MSELGYFQTSVPARETAAPRVISLARPASRAAAPSVRATAMVFEDPASLVIRDELERLALSDASLVIIGETGTGKELVARYIHEHSKRRARPFIAVNCGALVDSLVEAELFGYERGAFTGALKTQVGWFEAANGGTLLLDEIGDLPPTLQVKLLRVLQEREVVRVGARTPVQVDVRVIAATNIDLEAAVATGQFRQDLFFRLNVATVRLPPLRQRPRDIPYLADHFLALYRDKMERPELTLGNAARASLATHLWPGNIRELENVIHNAVLLAAGSEIAPSDLRLSRATETAHSATLEEEVRALVERRLDRQEPQLFGRMVEEIVRVAFQRNNSNQIHAADQLGVSRNTLRTQLAHLGIIAGRASRRRS